MSDTGPTSPDDPAWVDDIVKRALERAGAADPPSTAPSSSTPAVTTAPVSSPPPAPAPVAPRTTPTPATAAPSQVLPSQRAPMPADPAPIQEAVLDDMLTLDAQPEVTPPAPDLAAREYGDPRADGPYPDTDPELRPEPESTDSMSHRMRGFLEWGAVIVGALAVALVIKTFLMQAYFIPSESMVPTLEVGDRVLVNKLSYEFGDMSRGDLIVFHRPPNQVSGEDDLIKRVIALSGETVEIRDNTIFITQQGSDTTQQLTEPYLVDGILITGFVDTSGCVNPTPTSCEVPEGHVFVLGDNRDRSRDGRSFGPISEDLVVGRAFLRVWPLGDISFL